MRFLQVSGIKKMLKGQGLRTSRKFLEVLDHEVGVMLEQYSRMARVDKCKTVLTAHMGLEAEIKKLSIGLTRRRTI